MPTHRFLDTSLTIDERVTALLEELTIDEKISLIHTRMAAVERLGIKEYHIGAEVARGLVCRDGKGGEEPTTVFPEPFGLAATFDTALMRDIGEVTGVETRIYAKKGKTSTAVWGPTVDLERDPRWGRTEEGYGEDPFLTGEMSAAYTLGMRGVNEKYYRVIPTLKHFYANNREDDRATGNSVIPTPLKRDYYLKAYEKPIKQGGACAVMSSYNEINGVEGICNPELDRICKKEWGMLYSVTDGGDFLQNVQEHRRDKTHVESFARVYGNHGADIMTDNESVVNEAAKQALEQGLVSESDIDRALFGALKSRFLLGEFDENTPYDDYSEELICCDEHMKLAEKAAEESVVLLKNSGAVLPLSKNEKLAVIGFHANMNFRDWYTGFSPKNSTILDAVTAAVGRENVLYDPGCDIIALRNAETGFYFSMGRDGTLKCDSATINESCLLMMYEWGDGAVSFRSQVNGKFLADCGVMKCSSKEVYGWFVKELFRLERNGRDCLLKNWQDRYLYVTDKSQIGVTPSLRPLKSSVFNIELFSSGADRVRRITSEARNAVVFCGNNPLVNARECFDRKDLELPKKQEELMETVLSLNPNAVMYIVSGYPYAVNIEHLTAIMHICHAGPAMGTAVARTLFGDVSPAGRCPMTWYSSDRELCDIGDYNLIRSRSTYLYYEGEPLFPFGHGLSYTTFHYGAVTTDTASYNKGDTIKVSLELENTGMCDSDEVVQMYVVMPELPLTVPKKQLKAFCRVFVPRGEKVSVTLSLPVDELVRWNVSTDSFTVFSGTYELLIGPSSADIRKSCEVAVTGEECSGIDVSRTIAAVNSHDYIGVTYEADPKLSEYALINDWQSFISFHYCNLKAYHHIEAVVSNPGSACMLTVSCEQTGQQIASIEIPPTGGYTEFIQLAANAEPIDGIFTLRFTANSRLSFKSFRFF